MISVTVFNEQVSYSKLYYREREREREREIRKRDGTASCHAKRHTTKTNKKNRKETLYCVMSCEENNG